MDTWIRDILFFSFLLAPLLILAGMCLILHMLILFLVTPLPINIYYSWWALLSCHVDVTNVFSLSLLKLHSIANCRRWVYWMVCCMCECMIRGNLYLCLHTPLAGEFSWLVYNVWTELTFNSLSAFANISGWVLNLCYHPFYDIFSLSPLSCNIIQEVSDLLCVMHVSRSTWNMFQFPFFVQCIANFSGWVVLNYLVYYVDFWSKMLVFSHAHSFTYIRRWVGCVFDHY